MSSGFCDRPGCGVNRTCHDTHRSACSEFMENPQEGRDGASVRCVITDLEMVTRVAKKLQPMILWTEFDEDESVVLARILREGIRGACSLPDFMEEDES